MIDLPTFSKPVGAAVALGLLWIVEGLIPMFEGRRNRLGHDAANIVLGVANAVIASAVFAAATLWITEAAGTRSLGLLNIARLPDPWGVLAAIVVFDLWQYTWHRLNHRVAFLWRFHAVHHADRELDASSALRFHTGEIVLSSVARLAVLPLLGLTIGQVLAYEMVLLPIILFHHSNIRVPASLDRSLRWLIVTPWMHWVHHSDRRRETDSNYASVFSFWDRLFGSFRLRAEPGEISLGLGHADRAEWGTLRGMVLMPFRRGASTRRSKPPDEAAGPPRSPG